MGIMEKMRLDGKRSFVTGGARGIGKAIATALAEAGSDVALLDVDIATAQQTAAEIAQATGRVIRAYEVDVTQEAQVDAVVQQLIEDLGGLDCAFCNAGICLNVPAAEMTLAQWRKVIDINLTGVFLTARAAGRYMIGQGKGSIVNTASMSAHIVNVPQPQCSYNASKAHAFSGGSINWKIASYKDENDIFVLPFRWSFRGKRPTVYTAGRHQSRGNVFSIPHGHSMKSPYPAADTGFIVSVACVPCCFQSPVR